MRAMTLRIGLSAQIEHEVTAGDTAIAVGSGDVPVLATPRALALLEAATVRALRGQLGPAQTSVGVAVSLAHRAPTGIGRRVSAEAELVAITGRSLTFAVRLRDQDAVVAEGEVRRAVVDRERFLFGSGAAGG